MKVLKGTLSLCACIIFIVPSVYPSAYSDIEAIEKYWWTKHPSPPPDVCHGKEESCVERITGWTFLNRLKYHRLYSFQEGPSFHSSYAVLMVDDMGLVVLLKDREDFNELLASESIFIDDLETAFEIAQTFLRIKYYGGIKIGGWDLGLNIIEKPSDIHFSNNNKGEEQHNFVEQTYGIQSQRVEQVDESYHYIAYTWSHNSGNLERIEIAMDRNGIKDVVFHLIAEQIGIYNEY